AVVVGVAAETFPDGLRCAEGRLYRDDRRGELVVGSDLARHLRLEVGSRVPPFYRNREGEHVSEVVGIFHSDVSLWQARLVATSFETAAHIFDQPGRATDLLVTCRPGYEDEVRQAVLRGGGWGGSDDPVRPRVVARADLALLLAEGPARREGVFT